MPCWLVKSEPMEWSWDDQVNAGTTAWDGVTNAQAQNNLKAMKKGDRVLFYHSGKDKAVVGVCEVAKPAYPDPKDKSGRLVVVDLKAVRPVKSPVTLAQVKAEKSLAHLPLVKQPRLSVMPIDDAACATLLKLAGL